MINLLNVFYIFSFIYLWFCVASLIVWFFFIFSNIKEMDFYFDSPDFPLRGYTGVWPWGMGRSLSYGVFLLFKNSGYIKRKRPVACKSIIINRIPFKIRFMVVFPIYTVMPCAVFLWISGSYIYIRDWFF
ncbi:hypothetical protein L861_22745 [Litchfieldella anticariensis FP35 = DSM 16096]|uniref:Uncharacterized protein n=1 Tax=Litchfieldella anticariensis (strain DSM 16096 / CECT 5854 / CIP 108499 / LMG 22089 / FP35) TaxID=1121939 RepID=S2LED9_LITA3|nr:hypothetical protein L861_22745 [Halomonas anticariensis FP35 = DSM 16096]